MMRKLNKETDEYLIDFVHGKDDVLLENLGVRYRFRKDLIEYSDDYDYVGSPDNWDQTVKDLKSKINLDLSHIKNA